MHSTLFSRKPIVDGLVANGFAGDIFAQAKTIVTHHYQWAVVRLQGADLRRAGRGRHSGQRDGPVLGSVSPAAK